MRRISSGVLPKGFFFRDGWLSGDTKSLWLRLGLDKDEFGNDVIFRCGIEKFSCSEFMRDIVDASFGGRDVLGIVRGLDKPSAKNVDDDAEVLPRRYVVEILNSRKRVLARQEFAFLERPDAELKIAPSGTKAVLIWTSSATAQCRSGDGMTLCETGIVVDLTGK